MIIQNKLFIISIVISFFCEFSTVFAKTSLAEQCRVQATNVYDDDLTIHSRPELLRAVLNGDIEKTQHEISKLWFYNKKSTLNEDWGDKGIFALLQDAFDAGPGTTSYTLLSTAVKCGHLKVAELLLKEGAEIKRSFLLENIELIDAVKTGNIKIAELLLKYNARVNHTTIWNWSGLHEATKRGRADFVRLFLKHGANPRIEAYGETPSQMAMRLRYNEIARILEQAESQSPLLRPSGTLDWAILQGDVKRVEIFLKLGEQPNPNSCLYYALHGRNIAVAELLLKYHVNINVNARIGFIEQNWTLLHEAALRGRSDFIELLLRYGADSSVKSIDGLMPLEVAVREGYEKAAELLLQAKK